MLYNYPPVDKSDNWLHKCIIEALLVVHLCVDKGRRLPNWPGVLPIEHQAKLKDRDALKRRINDYRLALASLSPQERSNVRDQLVRQNQVKRLLSGCVSCIEIDALPDPIQEPAKKLFFYVFGLLSDLNVRRTHYEKIYLVMEDKVCPFCGIEAFAAPAAPSEDFDHYLPKSRYPFAGANLWNLMPAGADCNRKYKRDRNPLFADDNTRRPVVNPYGSDRFSVSLSATKWKTGLEGPEPIWTVELIPMDPKADTWCDVFKVRLRYERDVLVPGWKKWIDVFAQYAINKPAVTEEEVSKLLPEYCKILKVEGLSDRAFLKLAFFEMLNQQIGLGNAQLSRLLFETVKSKREIVPDNPMAS